MKLIKSLAVASILIAAPFIGLAADQPAPAEKPACCAKAEAAGGSCQHKCCVDAKAAGTACTKCKPAKK